MVALTSWDPPLLFRARVMLVPVRLPLEKDKVPTRFGLIVVLWLARVKLVKLASSLPVPRFISPFPAAPSKVALPMVQLPSEPVPAELRSVRLPDPL